MSENEYASESGSDTTSRTAPGNRASDAPEAPRVAESHSPNLEYSEGDYLRQQADDAAEAMQATLREISAKLKDMGDVRVWTQKYPWIATGLAVGAGFAAAVTLVPKDMDDAKHKWESIRSAFTPGKNGEDGEKVHVHGPRGKIYEVPAADVYTKESSEHKDPSTGWLHMLLHEAIQLLRPLLMTMIGAGMKGRGGDDEAADAYPSPPPGA